MNDNIIYFIYINDLRSCYAFSDIIYARNEIKRLQDDDGRRNSKGNKYEIKKYKIKEIIDFKLER